MKKKRIVIIILVAIILIHFLMRLTSTKELDDLSPNIPCDEELIEKNDVLWIIPNFENKSIAQNKEWCEKILALNKTIGLHGITHSFLEFETTKNKNDIEEGINSFEECFGYKPTLFKPPQLKISKENKILIKSLNLKIKNRFNQISHKVYHCENSGLIDNKIIDLF